MIKEKQSTDKSLESWIWDAACSIRGAKEVGSRKKAFQLTKADWRKAGQGKAVVRFYLPLVPDDPEQPVWSVIRKLSDQIGEGVTTHMRAIARENPRLQGISTALNSMPPPTVSAVSTMIASPISSKPSAPNVWDWAMSRLTQRGVG